MALLLSSFSALARKVPNKIAALITNCYTGQTTGLDKRISLNGYYRCIIHEDTTCSGYGKGMVCYTDFVSNMVLFDDGSCWSALQVGLDGRDFSYNNLEAVFPFQLSGGSIIRHDFWGIYKVVGDKIVVQYLNYIGGSWSDTYDPWQDTYRIIDGQTLELVPEESYNLIPYKGIKLPAKKKEREVYRFVPYAPLPSSDNWLKKDARLWCK